MLAIAGFAQKVSNKLSFQKGQKLQIVVQINSSASTAMGDNTADATITRIMDVQDASSTAATVEHKIKRIQFKVESAMGSQNFDSESPKDMGGPSGKTVSKALKNKYTITMDATGKVTAVKKDDDNPNTTTDSPADSDPTAALLSQLVQGIKLPAVGDKTEFSVLPDYEVGKGDTWTDSTDKRKTVYTLTDITATDIVVSFTTDETVHTEQAMMGVEITINSQDKTMGQIILDRKTGILKSKKADTTSEGTIDAMGQSAPMTKKLTRTTTVTAG